jgi:hypothetical protein
MAASDVPTAKYQFNVRRNVPINGGDNQND